MLHVAEQNVRSEESSHQHGRNRVLVLITGFFSISLKFQGSSRCRYIYTYIHIYIYTYIHIYIYTYIHMLRVYMYYIYIHIYKLYICMLYCYTAAIFKRGFRSSACWSRCFSDLMQHQSSSSHSTFARVMTKFSGKFRGIKGLALTTRGSSGHFLEEVAFCWGGGVTYPKICMILV